ncbi:hypothetical protein ACLMAB_14660 [Brevibacillus laterosporus]
MLILGPILAGACYFNWYDGRNVSELVHYTTVEEPVFYKEKLILP